MGIGRSELNILKDILRNRLNTGLDSALGHTRVLIPAALEAPLSTSLILKPKLFEDSESLSELEPNQVQQMETRAPLEISPIVNPEQIFPDQNIKDQIALAEITETKSSDQESKIDDKTAEKPKISLGQVVTNVLPLFMPAPMGMVFNFLSQAGDDKKETKYDKSDAQGTGAEAGAETDGEDKAKTGFWDTLSNGLSKMFEPITKPLAGIWNGIKKQIGVENFTDLFNLNSKFDTNESLLAAKKLEEQNRDQTLNEKKNFEKEIVAKEIEKQRRLEEIERERQFRLAQEAKANEARLAQEAQAKQAALAALTEKQRQEAVAAELASTDTNKPAVDEMKESLRRKIISINYNFGFSINPNLVGSNTSFADLAQIIKKAMIENPSSGLAYLYSQGKDLYSLSNNRMFRSNDSANMTTVLANYINRASDPTIALKSIDELHKEQGPTSLYNA